MIDRYSRKEIKKIWDEKNKYQIWLDIEIAVAQAMEKNKIIPRGVASKVKNKATINVDRIHKIESKVHHDVIAFLTSITEKVGKQIVTIPIHPNLKENEIKKVIKCVNEFS